VDEAGRVKGVFGAGVIGNRPALVLMDEDAEPQAILTLGSHLDSSGRQKESAPFLHLESASGDSFVTIGADDEGSVFSIGAGENREVTIEVHKHSIEITTIDDAGHERHMQLKEDDGSLRLVPAPTGTDESRQRSSNSPAAGQAEHAETGAHTAEELDIMESVFRYQFEHNHSGMKSDVDCIFLAVDQECDPSTEFLARFAGHSPPVEARSAADPDGRYGVHHAGKKDRCILFRIKSIRWIDKNTVDVVGGYHVASLSSSEDVYRVERRSGK
jgi:hypothetical protein